MNTVLNKYQLLEEIGRGSFSIIYKSKDIYTDKLCAIKIEPKPTNVKVSKDANPIPFIVREAHIHNRLTDVPEIPRLLWFGFDRDYYYMVLPLFVGTFRILQYNLETSKEAWIHAGNDMLRAVRSLHHRGYIHRDIKPDNFMFDERGKVYLIDLGLCKQYIRNGGQHVAPRTRTGVIGTINYISVNVHNQLEPSRRDDVESICYVLWKLCGGLDWDIQEGDGPEDISTIRSCKMHLTTHKDLPVELLRLLMKTRVLEYAEAPCYEL